MAPADPRIGQSIGIYKLEKCLASGGMGSIFLAQRPPDSQSERSILRVFKLLRHELADDSQGAHLFKREVQILLKLNHPNIVQLEDHGIHENLGRYICMEYITGHTLKAHLRRSPQPPEHKQILRWTQQLCESLKYFHGKQIIHRDLKPENIFLQGPDTPGETLKLFDFGIASCPDIEEIPARFVGTPRYMSPEQIRGDSIDGRADLYSLGVILYELLTHRPLFMESNSKRLREAHLFQTPPPLSQKRPDLEIPQPVEDLFRRLLAKHPNERPANAQEFYECIEAVLPQAPFARREGKLGLVAGNQFAVEGMDNVDTPPPTASQEDLRQHMMAEDFDEWDEELANQSFWQSFKVPLVILVLLLGSLIFILWGMSPKK